MPNETTYIKNQIQQLAELAVILSDYKNPDWIKNHDQAIKDMTAKVAELKALAKANHTLLGRVIYLPHADGNAMYIVTKINARTVRLDWCPWIDNWQDDVLEAGANVAIAWAKRKIEGEDSLSELFS